MDNRISTIGDLIHDRSNPRKHNPRNIKVIVDSLHDVGFARSIVIDEDNNILAGNGVTEAAMLAGIEKVIEVEADGNTIIAVRRRGLTDEQKQRLKYFDNLSGELADWDTEQLLADMQAGLDLSGMFHEDELDALLAEMQDVPNGDEWANAFNGLPDEDRQPFRQMTFTLHDSQANQVDRAIAIAKKTGDFEDSPNQNSNGNALSLICELFVTEHGDGNG